MLRSIKNVVVRFHQDDEGMEAIQIILIIAVAAMVCLGITQLAGVTQQGTGDDGWIGAVKSLIGEFLQ